ALRAAGAGQGLRLFGARAVDSMRLEKGHLHWKADLVTEYDPDESGVGRFVRPDKGDFVGRSALLARRQRAPHRRLVTLQVAASHAPAPRGASLMLRNEVVGTITSGEWGHRVGRNLAYAFVRPDLATPGTALRIDLCGDLVAAEVIAPSPYDPDHVLPRT